MAKVSVEYYDQIPEVPKDFDGAVAVHALALKAIRYWNDEIASIDDILDRERYLQSKSILRTWHRCKKEAQSVISTYQLKLF